MQRLGEAMNFLQFKHLLKLLGIHQKDDCNHAEAGRGGVHHLKVLDMVPESTHQPTVKKKASLSPRCITNSLHLIALLYPNKQQLYQAGIHERCCHGASMCIRCLQWHLALKHWECLPCSPSWEGPTLEQPAVGMALKEWRSYNQLKNAAFWRGPPQQISLSHDMFL